MSKLTKQQADELAALAALPDEAIDTSDIPEIIDWSGAVVGKFYRPLKRTVTIRLDADVLEWFRAQGGKYQSTINRVLRDYMVQHGKPNR